MNRAEQKFKNMTPSQRLEKIAALIQKAGERTGKFDPVLLTEAEVLGVYLLAIAVPTPNPDPQRETRRDWGEDV